MSGKVHGTNVHILPDENLGGVLREYVEVEGVYANNDDYVVIRSQDVVNYPIKMSKITITSLPSDSQIVKLEPTDIVRLREENGAEKRYRLVDRKAKVGEKVMYYKDGKSDGVVTTCIGYDEHFNDCIEVEPYLAKGDDEETCGFAHGYYRVLAPVEPTQTAETEPVEVDTRHASPQVIDMLANLAQRITEIERKLDDSRIDFIENEIDTLHANQRKLAEETTNRLDRHSERIRELAEMIGERSDKVLNFPIKPFKFSDLNGKTLRIYSAQDVTDELTMTVTVGIDIHDGKMYVLDSMAEVTRK
jgi:hypothetical protein